MTQHTYIDQVTKSWTGFMTLMWLRSPPPAAISPHGRWGPMPHVSQFSLSHSKSPSRPPCHAKPQRIIEHFSVPSNAPPLASPLGRFVAQLLPVHVFTLLVRSRASTLQSAVRSRGLAWFENRHQELTSASSASMNELDPISNK